MSDYQWSPYNAYTWIVRADNQWFSVTKEVIDDITKVMSWSVYTVEVDQFGKPTDPLRGIYVDGYTAGANVQGEYLPDRQNVDGIITKYVHSVPSTPAQEATGATEAPPTV